METALNKRKIVNDPVYGFITIPDDLVFDILEHPYFQRLRRVKQLGLSHLVYPGALHTRFHHALGAMYLMMQALEVLRSKDIEITQDEYQGALIAILLHDIGHGPFSHALEHSVVSGTSHEEISEVFLSKLNQLFDNKLSTAISIFRNEYPKHFLHQLVSSQLDMDRLDYLKRDTYFTGVSEGVIGTERIIKMLNVKNDELVVDAKGIYSIEKFLIARRLMYWQVYLHKTVISAESMLIKALQRAKELVSMNTDVFATPALLFFLKNDFRKDDFYSNPLVLENFALLDDFDIMASVKVWQQHPDKVLQFLAKSIVNRRLYKIKLQNEPFTEAFQLKLREKAARHFGVSEQEMSYYLIFDSTTNNAYHTGGDKIKILSKSGKITDFSDATEQLNVTALTGIITKYYVCFPKELRGQKE